MKLPSLSPNESDDLFARLGEDLDEEDRRSSSSSDFDDSRRVRVGDELVRSDDLFCCRDVLELVRVSVTRSRLRAESSNCLISRR